MKDGAHSHGSSGGGGLLALVIVAAVLVGSGAVSAIASALVTVMIVLAVIVALALAGGIAYMVIQARSPEKPSTALMSVNRTYLDARHEGAIQAPPARPQLEAAGQHFHLHLHGADPDSVDAVMARIRQQHQETP